MNRRHSLWRCALPPLLRYPTADELAAEYQARVVLAAFRLAAARSGESDWGSQPVVPMHRE
ncbi:hypothetical protein QFZ66_002256 [Streptomyces sp. B4I13]|uniref:hypothetical protein n=1 Tax=Streptomyces sp. B4I13 TaxID=3042271 RepID=UPI00278703C0|nr:hypothetical protein [Streptomyces sp. B4I13]MDQ0958378.1 hypothetical protein [Streptomyces sp. B4I13]